MNNLKETAMLLVLEKGHTLSDSWTTHSNKDYSYKYNTCIECGAVISFGTSNIPGMPSILGSALSNECAKAVAPIEEPMKVLY